MQRVSVYDHPTGDLDSDMPYAGSLPRSSRPRTGQRQERQEGGKGSATRQDPSDEEEPDGECRRKGTKKSARGARIGSGRVHPHLAVPAPMEGAVTVEGQVSIVVEAINHLQKQKVVEKDDGKSRKGRRRSSI
jgi:hypothetical protein